MSEGLESAVSHIVGEIVTRFVRDNEGTLVHKARARLGKDWRLLDRMTHTRTIQLYGDKYFPAFLALDKREVDSTTRDLAHKCTDAVLRGLREIYNRRGPHAPSSAELLSVVTELFPFVSDKELNVGLLFAYDFPRFQGSEGFLNIPVDAEGRIIQTYVSDDILQFESLETAWRDEERRRKAIAIKTAKAQTAKPANAGNPLVNIFQGTGVPRVSNKHLRHIVERDLGELNEVRTISALKSPLVLSGGLIESLLLDALLTVQARALAAQKADKRSGQPKPLDEWNLSSLIDVALELGLVTKDTHSLSNSIREYRNLIHPGFELRTSRRIRREIANIAEQVLSMVLNDLARKPGP